MLDEFKQSLTKIARVLNTDLRDLFKTEGRLVDHTFLDGLLATLIKTDMGVEAAQQMVERIRGVQRPGGHDGGDHRGDQKTIAKA